MFVEIDSASPWINQRKLEIENQNLKSKLTLYDKSTRLIKSINTPVTDD